MLKLNFWELLGLLWKIFWTLQNHFPAWYTIVYFLSSRVYILCLSSFPYVYTQTYYNQFYLWKKIASLLYASPLIWKLHLHGISSLNHTNPPFTVATFLQHASQWWCIHLGILSSMMKVLLIDLVFYSRITSISVLTLKPLLGVIGANLLKP